MENSLMKRESEEYLKHWFFKRKRKPLVIRGARQVGKSTLVRNFCKYNEIELIELNLEKYKQLNKLFETKNIKEICKEIEFITDKELSKPDQKVLFFDEIQATPEAIACLRYFYEELPDLAVISAGSLLEFTLSKHNYSMPVGRIEYLYLGPMNFMEFLEANKKTKLIEYINKNDFEYFSETAHEQLSLLLRDFIIVGGMPEAISTFLDTESLKDVVDVHLSIIETYQDDFAKYATHSQLTMLETVFKYVPRFLGNKIKYSNIDSNAQSREVKTAINLLIKAGVINKVKCSNGTGIPLGAEVNSKKYKLYFLDIGLVNTICGVKHLNLETLKNVRFINEGNIAEQFIAQHLFFSNLLNAKPELFYWLREGKSKNAEIDFLISINNKIVPVEVKSGKSGSLKSLHQFIKQKKSKTACRFDLNKPSKQKVDISIPNDNCNVNFELISLPLYNVVKLNINR